MKQLVLLAAFISMSANHGYGAEPLDRSDEHNSLDEYNCDNGAGVETRNRLIGQVIHSEYHEWVETYRRDGKRLFIRCISKLLPLQEKLSGGAAVEFLNESKGLSLAAVARQRTAALVASRVIENPRDVSRIPAGNPIMDFDRERASSSIHMPATEPHVTSGLKELTSVPNPTMGRSPAGTPAGTGDALSRALDYHGDVPPAPSRPPQSSEPAASIERDSIERRLVDSVDDRLRVTDASTFPWNVVASLYIEFPDGNEGGCTGTLVSRYVIITAGHCLHSRDSGGFVVKATAAPGQTQANFFGSVSQPYGEKSARYVAASERWKQISGGSSRPVLDFAHDYAAMFFDTPWNYTSTFMPILYGDTATFANNAGYPGVVMNTPRNAGMWYHSGDETNLSQSALRNFQIREFSIDSSGGNSGGPLWKREGDSRYLVGILTYGAHGLQQTGGPWLGGANQTAIRAFAQWTPSTSSPTTITAGARQTGVFSSRNAGQRSYVRLFNGSASSGVAAVAIWNSLNGQRLGTWTSPSIAPLSSIQIEVAQIEAQAGLPRPPATNLYSFAVTANFTGYVQNIVWNDAAASLTNVSNCSAGLSRDVARVMNFHSSRNGVNYPSQLILTNVSNAVAPVTVRFFDSLNGQRIGDFHWSEVPSNGTFYMDSNYIDFHLNRLYGFSPSTTQYHYNIEIIGDFPGYLQHIVNNVSARVLTDMSVKCDLNPKS